jgi:hypothetical protein
MRIGCWCRVEGDALRERHLPSASGDNCIRVSGNASSYVNLFGSTLTLLHIQGEILPTRLDGCTRSLPLATPQA